jgi:hypothetical protein
LLNHGERMQNGIKVAHLKNVPRRLSNLATRFITNTLSGFEDKVSRSI